MTTVNPKLIKEIKNYSKKDFNIDACFNCGNCTAICPLTTSEHSFPRALIRYGQIGMREKLLTSKDIWICSYCNECSDTCPRNATPGEFVAATRKWAIAQYDITNIAKIMYKSIFAKLIAIIGKAIFTLTVLLVIGNPSAISNSRPLKLFDLFSKESVELLGIVFGLILFLVVIVSTLNMFRILTKPYDESFIHGISTIQESSQDENKRNSLFHLLLSPRIMLKSFFQVLGKDVLLQQKLTECNASEYTKKPLVRTRWFTHQLIFYGFIGLLIATIGDMIFKPDSNIMVPIYFPTRLLGIISGIALVLGTSMALLARIRKSDKYAAASTFDDYFLLVLLWFIGITGFLTTITFYITLIPATWGYYFFIIHLLVVVELFALAPFTKFAHIWYRFVALWLTNGLEIRQTKLMH